MVSPRAAGADPSSGETLLRLAAPHQGESGGSQFQASCAVEDALYTNLHPQLGWVPSPSVTSPLFPTIEDHRGFRRAA